MKRIFKLQFLFIAIVICNHTFLHAQQGNKSNESTFKKHALETSPLTPFGDVYSLGYNYQLDESNVLLTGLSFVNIKYEGVGNNSAPGIILGYRRFLWKGLHAQYELWPGYDNFYEKNEDRHYKGFQLWNEFRVGYQFNIKIKSLSTYINLQWPLGFYLIKGNKPDSFIEYEKDHKYFYDTPLVYLGVRF